MDNGYMRNMVQTGKLWPPKRGLVKGRMGYCVVMNNPLFGVGGCPKPGQLQRCSKVGLELT